MDKTIEKRKKVIYDLICDDLYVPMKFKELAMLLQVPKDQRNEFRKILETLEAEGKIYLDSLRFPARLQTYLWRKKMRAGLLKATR